MEESKENALTSFDIIMRMNGNLNSSTLGKEIKKLFKHVKVKGIRTKEDWTKKNEFLYNGIFWKADETEFISFTFILSLFLSDFFTSTDICK